jgi:hypothetical protein
VTVKRYPWAPFERLALAEDPRSGLKGIARRLGVHDRQTHRWRTYGLDAHQADRCAIRLGLHPSVVWPEWSDDGLSPSDRLYPLDEWWRTAWLAREAS